MAARMMLAHRLWDKGLAIALAAEWRGAVVALLGALAAGAAARLVGVRWLAAASCGIGLAAGWAALSNLPAWPPHTLAERLPEAAAIALAGALLAEARALQRVKPVLLVGIALVCGWWLAGAPQSVAALRGALFAIAVLTGWLAAMTLLLAQSDASRVAAAALALWAALCAIDAPAHWIALALAPPAAVLGSVIAAGRSALLVPAAAGIGAVVGGAMIAAGSLQHGRIAPIDFAGGAPLLALWLSGRWQPRLRRLGGAAPAGAATLALLATVLLSYTAAALGGAR
ncbi:MAG: hypothetical protein JO047_14025 [Alphaproteobacteria bacterium]|nr:hypothetical protein [Alphaproteobacteria bacterium]